MRKKRKKGGESLSNLENLEEREEIVRLYYVAKLLSLNEKFFFVKISINNDTLFLN